MAGLAMLGVARILVATVAVKISILVLHHELSAVVRQAMVILAIFGDFGDGPDAVGLALVLKIHQRTHPHAHDSFAFISNDFPV